MRYYNILDFKFQELYVFLAAAEYQSITKAAEFLFLTPSQVSKVIKKLEDLWGIQLFLRNKNTIRLTPAGKHAYQKLNHTVHDIERILDETVQIQKVMPFLRVGCPSLSLPNELFVPILEDFRQLFPHTTVSIECCDTLAALKQMLLADKVDLIYTANIEVQEHSHLIEWQAMEELPLYIIVNQNHPLASQDHVSVNDLTLEEFILTTPTSENHADYAVQLCETYGFLPHVSKYVPNIYSQMMEIHINPHVVCIQSIKGIQDDQKLRYWEIPEVSWKMGFAYKKNAPELIKKFVACAANFFRP